MQYASKSQQAVFNITYRFDSKINIKIQSWNNFENKAKYWQIFLFYLKSYEAVINIKAT